MAIITKENTKKDLYKDYNLYRQRMLCIRYKYLSLKTALHEIEKYIKSSSLEMVIQEKYNFSVISIVTEEGISGLDLTFKDKKIISIFIPKSLDAPALVEKISTSVEVIKIFFENFENFVTRVKKERRIKSLKIKAISAKMKKYFLKMNYLIEVEEGKNYILLKTSDHQRFLSYEALESYGLDFERLLRDKRLLFNI